MCNDFRYKTHLYLTLVILYSTYPIVFSDLIKTFYRHHIYSQISSVIINESYFWCNLHHRDLHVFRSLSLRCRVQLRGKQIARFKYLLTYSFCRICIALKEECYIWFFRPSIATQAMCWTAPVNSHLKIFVTLTLVIAKFEPKILWYIATILLGAPYIL